MSLKKLIGIIIIFGVVTAMMSTLEPRVAWIASFCGAFGGGCSETVQYTILGIPVAYWGLAYYTGLAVLYLIRPRWLFFPVMAGMGAEAVMVVVMIRLKLICLLCIINFIWMSVLFLLFFDYRRFSLMLATGLAIYIPVDALITAPYAQVETADACSRPQTVLARVDDREITQKEVDQPLTTRLHKLQTNIYDLRKNTLDAKIDDILLEKEAARRKITVQALKEVFASKAELPDERMVDSYFATGRYRKWGNWTGSGEEIKEKIRQYLTQSLESRQILDHCRKLEKEYPVSIFLEPPDLPLTRVKIDGCPSQGPASALVIVVELSDYLCPACRKGQKTVKRVKKAYKDKIRWVFRENPLESIHPGAGDLALAARCAGDQGAFWAFHDLLFSEKKPGFEDALQYARELGLDMPRFSVCTADQARREKLIQESNAVRRAGITSTPSLIINGTLHVGVPSFEKFCELIDQALADAGA